MEAARELDDPADAVPAQGECGGAHHRVFVVLADDDELGRGRRAIRQRSAQLLQGERARPGDVPGGVAPGGSDVDHEERRVPSTDPPSKLGRVGLEDDALEVHVHRRILARPGVPAGPLLDCPTVAAPLAVESRLGAWQEERGARWGELAGGGWIALDYGDPAGEYEALRENCGLVDLSWRDRLLVTGADRRRFVNAYVTCDIKELSAGQSAFGFLTSAQGRILADATFSAIGERLLVLLPPGRGTMIREHLARFVLADRVELAPDGGATPLALVGPGTPAVLQASGARGPAGSWNAVPWPELVEAGGGAPGGERGERTQLIWVGNEQAAAVAARFVGAGARPVGSTAMEILRVESGIPRFGVDYDEAHFPQETGLEDAVSYSKGCYLGQEVVARIHYRGHVNRKLCGVVFDPCPETGGTPFPAPSEPLLLGGEAVGQLGSVVVSARLQRPVGLAVLHVKAATPGTVLETGSGAAATVASLPFVD